jgi:hypothetical protein
LSGIPDLDEELSLSVQRPDERLCEVRSIVRRHGARDFEPLALPAGSRDRDAGIAQGISRLRSVKPERRRWRSLYAWSCYRQHVSVLSDELFLSGNWTHHDPMAGEVGPGDLCLNDVKEREGKDRKSVCHDACRQPRRIQRKAMLKRYE